MLALCERLRDRLESPFEKTLRILFAASSGPYTWKYLITDSLIYRASYEVRIGLVERCVDGGNCLDGSAHAASMHILREK